MSYKLYETYPAKSISYGASRKSNSIKYIVIHATGNQSDTAVANAKFYAQTNTRSAGAHYFVDQTDVYRSIPDLKVAYAVGGSKYTDTATTGGAKLYGIVTNNNSISIEMCSKNSIIQVETLENTIALTRKLMQKYTISPDSVVRHFDVTGKHCPYNTGWIINNISKWTEFKKTISAPFYQEGTAKLNKDLFLRSSCDHIDGNKILYDNIISDNMKKKCINSNGYAKLKANTEFNLTDIKYRGYNIYGRIGSTKYYIPIFYNGINYIK